MTPQELLLETAKMIEEQGWWDGNGDYPKAGGPVCAWVAMCSVSRRMMPDTQARLDVINRAYQRLSAGAGWKSVVRWNDEQPDGATVIAKLREVAQK